MEEREGERKMKRTMKGRDKGRNRIWKVVKKGKGESEDNSGIERGKHGAQLRLHWTALIM